MNPIHELSRDVLGEYVKHVASLGQILLQFMSEALGLASDHLERLQCLEGLRLSAHYYPPCLDLNINLGTTHHSDPCFFTVLLQDQIGGLQVLHRGDWVDVPPLEGALVINVGDLLQVNFIQSLHIYIYTLLNRSSTISIDNDVLIRSGAINLQLLTNDKIYNRYIYILLNRSTIISIDNDVLIRRGAINLQLLTNDKLKSAVHRVLINRVHSRTSVACLFSSYRSKALHRPIKELLSMNDRSMYREVTTGEYTVHYMTKVKDFTSALVDFRV